MGRKKKLSDQTFIDAHKACENQIAIAKFLGIALPTVYAYQERLGLMPKKRSDKNEQSMAVYNAYKGLETIRTLSIKFETMPNNIRYHLDRAIVLEWRKPKPPIYPPPKRRYEVKIIHALLSNPELFDDPPQLSTITDLPIDQVNSYLDFAFQTLEKKQDNAQVPSRRKTFGKRARPNRGGLASPSSEA